MVENSAMGGIATGELRNTLVVVVVSVVVFTVAALLRKLLWQPLKMRRIMIKQGVAAAPFHFLVGSLPECFAYAAKFSGDLHVDDHYDSTPTVSPMNILYFPKNEKFFVYEWGSEPRLASRDPEFAKEVLLTARGGDFGKARMNSFILEMILGHDSVAVLQDVPRHDKHRQILNPFFYTEGLRTMVDSMVEGALPTIQTWEEKVALGGVADFDVLQDVHAISGKIISLTAFSNDYEKGRKLYDNQMKLLSIVFKSMKNPLFWAPGYRLLPTSTNREMARLKKEIQSLLDDIVGTRKKARADGSEKSYGNDLLSHMLQAAEGKGASAHFTLDSVFRNAEALYFAGQDTVANAIGFSLLMLARHPEWQQRARQEVNGVCGSPNGANIDAAKLNRLKIMGMIINETLRLFVILPKIAREAKRNIQIGDLFIPKGMTVEISLQAMHLDSTYWGKDVFKFNPERFANGVSKACTHPQAFLPFSTGPNFCIGSNFAMMELKVVLAMVLERFQILVSPDYKHHPHLHLVQRPRYGLPLVLKAL